MVSESKSLLWMEGITNVLILVIMEFGFWGISDCAKVVKDNSLNPCYNGIWFLSIANYNNSLKLVAVLILVIMEFGFWELEKLFINTNTPCLNPCYNGIWFLSLSLTGIVNTIVPDVLILVIMEFGFWVWIILKVWLSAKSS